MSKKLLGASLVALLFSSVCFANVQETGDADPITQAAEMKSMILFCEPAQEAETLPTDAS